MLYSSAMLGRPVGSFSALSSECGLIELRCFRMPIGLKRRLRFNKYMCSDERVYSVGRGIAVLTPISLGSSISKLQRSIYLCARMSEVSQSCLSGLLRDRDTNSLDSPRKARARQSPPMRCSISSHIVPCYLHTFLTFYPD